MDSVPAGSLKNVSTQPVLKLINIKLAQSGQGIDEGTWDAIHVVTTSIEGNQAKYTSVSAVFALMNCSSTNTVGKMDLGGNLNMMKEQVCELKPKQDVNTQHIGNIGRLVEQIESEMRSEVHGIFLNKPKGIINGCRYPAGMENSAQKKAH